MPCYSTNGGSVTREIPGVQNPVVRYAKARGWLAWKMRIEGRRGAPDYWCFRAGQIVIIEFKAETGSLSEQQKRRIRELTAQGFPVHVIDNADAGRALFDSFEDDLL